MTPSCCLFINKLSLINTSTLFLPLARLSHNNILATTTTTTTRCLSQSKLLPSQFTGSSNNKRITYKKSQHQKTNDSYDTDAQWSVIAYNISEELKIDKAHKLLENFKEYQINQIPPDVNDEAIMLSLTPQSQQDSSDNGIINKASKGNISAKPLHDIFLFREGTIVFWGVPYDQQKRILYGLSPLKIDPYSSELVKEEREHLIYNFNNSIEKSRMNRDIVQLAQKQDRETLILDQFAFSHAVTQSVKLAIWEAMLDQYIESVSGITNQMKLGKRIQLTRDQVFRRTGEIYELKHNINLDSDLLDLPDVYWDRHDQEMIFQAVTSFLNIRKRTAVINEKLNNCCELMNLLSGHMNDRHHTRLEWMIIVLITVEVLFEVSKLL